MMDSLGDIASVEVELCVAWTASVRPRLDAGSVERDVAHVADYAGVSIARRIAICHCVSDQHGATCCVATLHSIEYRHGVV